MSKRTIDQWIDVMLDETVRDEQREEAALAIGKLGDDALPRLRQLLRSERADDRWWSTRTLAALGTSSVPPLLVEALSDPSPDVRACAALGLGAMAVPDTATPLVQSLADDSAYVRRIVGNALIQIGPPAVSPLIQALSHPSPAVRASAARALAPLESPEAIAALFAALDDDSALVTYYAEEALARLGVGMVLVKP